MTLREAGKIYFGREILDIFKEGDLVESKEEFPFMMNSKAIYMGLQYTYNKAGQKQEAIGLISRPKSDKKDKRTALTSLRFELDNISLIGNKIIFPKGYISEELKKGDFDYHSTIRIFAELIARREIWFYDKEHKNYNRYYEMLRRHNL